MLSELNPFLQLTRRLHRSLLALFPSPPTDVSPPAVVAFAIVRCCCCCCVPVPAVAAFTGFILRPGTVFSPFLAFKAPLFLSALGFEVWLLLVAVVVVMSSSSHLLYGPKKQSYEFYTAVDARSRPLCRTRCVSFCSKAVKGSFHFTFCLPSNGFPTDRYNWCAGGRMITYTASGNPEMALF